MKKLLCLLLLALGVAALYGQSVSSSGAFTYRYDLDIPEGPNGFGPDLSLVYNSQAGNGIMGLGWSIDGLGQITRDSAYPINYDGNDHYRFNGQKLIKDSTGVYHTEIENYLKIEANLLNTEESYWTVKDKDGTVYYYGMAPYSAAGAAGDGHIQALNSNGTGKGKARLWALSKVVDVHGNEWSVDYLEANGSYYPGKISLDQISIDFTYENRSDHFTKYIPTPVGTIKRLKHIIVKVDSNILNEYSFAYSSNGSSIPSLLNKISHYGVGGDNGINVPRDVDFSHNSDNSTYLTSDKQVLNANTWVQYRNQVVGDFDGDGIDDILLIPQEANHTLRTGSIKILKGDALGTYPAHWFTIPSSTWSVYRGIFPGDFNGDGKTDLLLVPRKVAGDEALRGGKMIVLESTGSTFIRKDYWEVPDETWASYRGIVTGDYNGDGRTDILLYPRNPDGTLRTGGIYFLESTGSIFICRANWASVPDSSWYGYLGIYPGDYNGDGQTDILLLKKYTDDTIRPGDVYVWESRGNFSVTRKWGNIPNSSWKYYKGIYPGDYNGDGKTDLLFIPADESTNYSIENRLRTGNIWVWTSDGTYFKQNIWFNNDSTGYNLNYLSIADYSGDGKTDVLLFPSNGNATGSGNARLWKSFGDSFVKTEYSSLIDNSRMLTLNSGDNGNPQTVHFNSDSSGSISGQLRLYSRSNINEYAIKQISNSTGFKVNINYSLHWGNISDTNRIDSRYPEIYQATPRFLVDSFITSDGLDNQYETKYEYFNSKIYVGTPDVRKSLGFEKVKRTNPDGTYTITYYHQDVVKAGYPQRIESYGNDDKLYTIKCFEYDKQTFGTAPNQYHRVYKTDEYDFNYNGVSLPVYSSTPVIITRSSFSQSDKYGNVGEEIHYGQIIGVTPDNLSNPIDVLDDYTQINSTFVSEDSDSVWISRVSSIVKREFPLSVKIDPVSNADTSKLEISADISFEYDDGATPMTKGLLTSKIEKLDDSTEYKTTYGYQSNGLLEWVKDPRLNNSGYTSTTGYTLQYDYTCSVDNEEKVFPTSVKNALGHIRKIQYNSRQQVISETDINDKIWGTTYDELGRIETKSGPDGSTVEYQYVDAVIDPDGNVTTPQYVQTKTEDGIGPEGNFYTYTYLDGLGRVIQEKVEALNGLWRTVDYFYHFGSKQVTKKTVAYYSNSFSFSTSERIEDRHCYTNQYDSYGRLWKRYRSISTTSGETLNSLPYIEYQHKIYTDLSDNFSVFHSIQINEEHRDDDTGLLIHPFSIIESSGASQIEYVFSDNFSSDYKVGSRYSKIETVTAFDGTKIIQNGLENTAIITRTDRFGRKLEYTDPDMGTWTYSEYDRNHNLRKQVDGEGNEITFAYDALNRIDSKTSDDGLIDYDYDDTVWKGLLTSLSKTGYSEEYVYNAVGLVESKTVTIDTVSKTTSYTYDLMGRLKTETFPDGEKITYKYDQDGNPSEMTWSDGVVSGTYISAISYHGSGKVNQITLGNGNKTQYLYTSDSDRLNQIKINGTMNTSVNISYQYNNFGNITERSGSVLGDSFIESFGYDYAFRLNSFSSNITGSQLSSTYSHTSLNNIQEKDGRQYKYESIQNPGTDDSYKQIHAATDDGNYSYEYDKNGNLTLRTDKVSNETRSFSYDTYNRLIRIADSSGYSEDYSYGDSTRRIKKVENKADGTKIITRYFFGDYEERTYTEPISAGSLRAGIDCMDDATGDGFIMFSAQNVHSRFSSKPPNANSSDHFIAVKFINNQWYYDRGNELIAFTPISTDRLIASVSFSEDTIESLEGSIGQYHDIQKGYPSGDLTFKADLWGGITNDGEFTVGGNYFDVPIKIEKIKHYSINGQVVAQRSDLNGLVYLHQDHLGSTILTTSGSLVDTEKGRWVTRFAYDPWGSIILEEHNTIVEDNSPEASRLFTGQEHDKGTGFHYYGARYYDPALGRFLQADTYLDGLNRYTYCGNNPVRYMDPTGHGMVDGQEIPDAAIAELDHLDQLPDGANVMYSDPNIDKEQAKATGTIETESKKDFADKWNEENDKVVSDLKNLWLAFQGFMHQASPSYSLQMQILSDLLGEFEGIDNAFTDAMGLSVGEAGLVLGADLNFQMFLSALAGAASPSSGAQFIDDGIRSKNITFTTRQLQKKYKHAADFGIINNYSPMNGRIFQDALSSHLDDPATLVIQGTYRNQTVTHYLNPISRQNVIIDSSNNFHSAWKLGTAQFNGVLRAGVLW